ncbi:hypothetical protein [Iocasia frigidifontis]|nr:hypothetical protein [Iocasia fonsfrigidae]
MEMTKRKEIKDDGRYIIFYEFKGDKDNIKSSKYKEDSKGERS